MKQLTRRSFNGLATKGLLGSAFLANMPLANAFTTNKNSKKLGVALVGRVYKLVLDPEDPTYIPK